VNQKRLWMAILGGGSVAALGLGALIYNERGNIDAAREAVVALHDDIAGSRKLLTTTSPLEREVIVLRETEQAIKEILPDETDVNNLVRDLSRFKEETGVQITGLKKKQVNVAAKKEKSDFDKVAYQLTLEADAFQLLGFMDRIERHSRFMRIPDFKLTAAPRRQVEDKGTPAHKVQLDVETYVYRPQDGPAPVKVDGYARKRELLMGEIQRRRQALTVASYDFRGQRGRRDPWVDPRVPVESENDSGLSVEDQIQIVEELIGRTQQVLALWESVQHAENVIIEMTQRAELEESLAHLEEDVRRRQEEGGIHFVTAARQLQRKVIDPITAVRVQISESDGGRGPTKEALRELVTTMENHLANSEYDLALTAYATVEPRIEVAERDPQRAELATRLKQLAVEARTASDFAKIKIQIGGVAIMEGSPPLVLINGQTLGEGDLVGDELIIRSIRPGVIEFLFRGMILERRF
jgi:Tfp pilus assembly protein PilO